MKTNAFGALGRVSRLTLGGGGIGQAWRPTSRDEAIADADALDLATGSGPVLHCIGPGCQVGAEYIHK